MEERITIKSGEENLAVFLQRAASSARPDFLFLHGAGTSCSARTRYLATRLAARGVPSLSLDFSGHGESSGRLLDSSLAKRVSESLSVRTLLAKAPITLCGSSMGGHIALRLLEEVEQVSRLVLFCPAVYDQRAYTVPFGGEFSEIIRQAESWRNTEILAALRRFTGEFFIFIGEEDEVIPEGVIHLLDQHSPNVRLKKIVRFPNCPHQIHYWLARHPELADSVVKEILGE